MSLLLSEFYRIFFIAIRYPTNFVVQILMSVSLFYLLLMGGGYFQSSVAVDSKVELMLINYFFWTVAVPTISSIPQSIEDDAKSGTLEQVLQSVYPSSIVFLVRGFANNALQILIGLIIMFVLITITGVVPRIGGDVGYSVVSVILTSLGISLLLGGIGVRAKRTGILVAALQLPLLYLLVYPFEHQFGGSARFEWWLFLPFVADSIQARHLITSDQIEMKYYLYSYSMAMFWLVVGFISFVIMLRHTKKSAKTNGY